MPSWPSVLMAGAAGAYAANTATQHPEIVSLVSKSFKGVDFGTGTQAYSNTGGAANAELAVLQSEVDRLHKLLADVLRNGGGGGRYTVIHTGRSGWFGLIVPVAVAGGVVYVYFRFRGWNFADFFYVTRSSMQNFRSTVTEGFGKMWEEMKRTKEEFVAKILHVSQRQEHLVAQQQEIDKRLQKVGTDVHDIRSTADDISVRVEQLDGKVEEVATGVERSNRGILVLCAAISEVTKRIPGMNHNCTSQMLETFIQTTPPQLLTSVNNTTSGLRGLLDGEATSTTVPALPPVSTPTLTASASMPASQGSALWERGFFVPRS